jgi:hypothetical protein
MTTALQLIETSAKKLGALQAGESLSAADAADSLAALNSMLDGWSIDRLLVYEIQQDTHTWPASTTSRSIGTGGNFNVTRPTKIEKGTFFRDSSNNDYPVIVTMDRVTYDSLTVKSTTGTYPNILFYDPAYPLGLLYVYPTPSVALTLHLNTWQVLQNFASLTTDLSLPPGYQRAIEFNLAVELEPIFNLKVPDSVVRIAAKSMAALKAINAPTLIASVSDAAAALGQGGRWDIYSDGN